MKAIHASYLLAIACCALGGSMGDLPASAQGDASSEDFLIGQLRPAPPEVQYLRDNSSDSSLANKERIEISSNGPACGPAGGGRPGMPGRPPGPDPEFLKTLGLSDEQREKLHAIRAKEQLATASRISDLIKLRHQLMESITGTEKGDAKDDALSIQRQINSLENANQLDRITSMLEAKAVFTEEQQKQMRRHMLEHEPFMGPPPPGPMRPMGPMGPMGDRQPPDRGAPRV
jgi:Spy/CpxP family protein refolding chaperone